MDARRASATARLIALATLRPRTRHPDDQPLPHSVQVARAALRAGGRRDALAAAVAGTLVGAAIGAIAQRATIPGLARHYQRRKRLLNDWCTTALDAGFQQLIVLGAGFDALALRALERPSPARAIEIDHPATQLIKSRALAAIPDCPRPHLVPADLAACDAAALWHSPPIEAGLSTLVVAEGLLMYLPPPRVEALFLSLRAAAFPEAAIAFTFMDVPEGAPIRFHPSSRLVSAWLRRKGEPFQSSIDGADLAVYLSRLGWNLRECVRFTRPAGESAALVERGV